MPHKNEQIVNNNNDDRQSKLTLSSSLNGKIGSTVTTTMAEEELSSPPSSTTTSVKNGTKNGHSNKQAPTAVDNGYASSNDNCQKHVSNGNGQQLNGKLNNGNGVSSASSNNNGLIGLDIVGSTTTLKNSSSYEPELGRPKKVYKVVLTGGPCGGKTTGQARLCTFFENLGWKVFRVPEAATILLGGGIKFSELNEDQAMKFQEELLRTMMQVESVFFKMAESINRDVLIICDRGAMDASAFIPREKWEEILTNNGWNEVELRDTRYNQIIHMVSAANGAEPFYTLEDHNCRSEGLDLARELDQKAAQSWVGHPYFDVVDNSTDFETKLNRLIMCVCQKLGIDVRDRLQTNAKKVKFLVKGPLNNKDFPPGFQDFTVVHDYLQTNSSSMQARLRKRGQKGNWSYTYTARRPELEGQVVEVKTALTQRDYNNLLLQRDHNHVTVYKTRRCFLLNDQYFQLDVYNDPCHKRCKGLVLLETYSTLSGSELQQRLPSFLNIVTQVTGDPRYSMFNLSLKQPWSNNKHFCLSLAGHQGDKDESQENGALVSKSESCLAGC